MKQQKQTNNNPQQNRSNSVQVEGGQFLEENNHESMQCEDTSTSKHGSASRTKELIPLAVDNHTEEKGNVIFVVEKRYEDGWNWYCGYKTIEEAKMRAQIVFERDNREIRIRKFIEVKDEF